MKNLTIPALIAAMLATSAAWAAETETQPAPTQQPPQSPMATLFAQADANHDGKLDSQEFTEFERLRDAFMAQHHPQFSTLDKNGDGFITADELRAGRMGQGPMGMHGKGMRGGDGPLHDSLFKQADADHNGTLSQDEYQKFVELSTARRTQKGRTELTYPDFATLDTNKDGQLDHEELHNGMRNLFQQMKSSASAAKPAI